MNIRERRRALAARLRIRKGPPSETWGSCKAGHLRIGDAIAQGGRVTYVVAIEGIETADQNVTVVCKPVANVLSTPYVFSFEDQVAVRS